MNEWYSECRNAEDVDRVTSIRINRFHGSLPADELKNLRRGMVSIVAMMRPDLFPNKDLRNFLLARGDKLLALNAQIENVIEEGRAYKKEKGWA